MPQITPGVYAFTGLMMGRVYALEGADGLTLVDAGLGWAAGQVLRQLQAQGHSPSAVKRILITHAHPDHIGGLPKLQAATGAQVIAHGLEHPMIEGQLSSARHTRNSHSPDVRGATPMLRQVHDGEIVPEVLGGLQVMLTPGHTAGHVCFWQPDRRLLFCGDVVMRLPQLRLPFAAFTVDMDENKRSVKRLAELEADMVCFGHGQPLTRNAASQLRAFATKL
jgi:glyoxylase-like metal-dependent hydrolase (beta-lactamase superfamily II)